MAIAKKSRGVIYSVKINNKDNLLGRRAHLTDQSASSQTVITSELSVTISTLPRLLFVFVCVCVCVYLSESQGGGRGYQAFQETNQS